MARQENELTEPIVKWIESEMARRKWKPADLSRRASVSQGVLSRMFNRQDTPKVETLKGVARAFRMSLRELQLAALDALRGEQENGPSVPQASRSVREPGSGYPSGAGEEDAAYLRTALEVSRALSNADREGLPLEAKLRLIDLAEKVMVPVYGKRATTFLNDERARLRGGEDSSSGRSP